MTPAEAIAVDARRERWKGIVIVGLATALAITIAILVATVISGNTSQDAREHLQKTLALGSCTRGNVVRAYLIVDAGNNKSHPRDRAARARRLFPILNCEQTVSLGTPVPLLPRSLRRRQSSRSRRLASRAHVDLSCR